MNCLCFNVNTFGIPMCAQLPVSYKLWEGPEDDWITVETCSPIVISENKCCAHVKKLIYLYVIALRDAFIQKKNPTTAAAFRKAIKDTHCIKFIFANEHNLKQNYAMINQKVPS